MSINCWAVAPSLHARIRSPAPGAELVDIRLRIAVGPTSEVEKLNDEQLPAAEARMLHGGRRMADHGADLHHTTRMLPTVVERRIRVNVSGVVIPSPVGVAMLKLA